MTGIIHPWRLLRGLEHITLLWHDRGPKGLTDFEAGTISIRRGLTQAQRRSACLHEVLHVHRGAVPMGLAPKEEERVRRETARLFLPDIHVVGDALVWAEDMAEAADDLWIDQVILRDRLRTLHPAERGYLRQRLDDVHD